MTVKKDFKAISTDCRMRPRTVGGRKGFVDDAGDWVIAPRYEDVDFFREGVSWVKAGGKWGLIDQAGAILIEPRYEAVREFNGRLGYVKIGGKWGIVDRCGNVIVNPEFDSIGTFMDSGAVVNKDGMAGHLFLHPHRVNLTAGDKAEDFSEGLAAVKVGQEWGYVNQQGEMVIMPQYCYAGDFSEGKAYVEFYIPDENFGGGTKKLMQCTIDREGNRSNVEEVDYYYDSNEEEDELDWIDVYYGIIDTEGHYVRKPIFQKAKPYIHGKAWVKIDNKWGLIDADGAYVYEPIFDGDKDPFFSQGNEVYCAYLNGEEIWINLSGKIIPVEKNPEVECKMRSLNIGESDDFPLKDGYKIIPLSRCRHENFRIVEREGKRHGKEGVLGRDGNFIIPPEYDNIIFDHDGRVFVYSIKKVTEDMEYDKDGFFAGTFDTHISRKQGMMNEFGEEILPPVYDEIKGFSRGVSSACKDGKWGLIDTSGKAVVDFQYEEMNGFFEDSIWVKLKGKWGAVNRKGNVVILPIFDSYGQGTREGYWFVTYEGKECLIDSDGFFIIRPHHVRLDSWTLKENMIAFKGEKHYGYLFLWSDEAIPPVFEFALPFSDGRAIVTFTESQLRDGLPDASRRLFKDLDSEKCSD